MEIDERIAQLFRDEADGPAVQYEGSWWTWNDIRRIIDGIDSLLRANGLGAGTGVGLVLRERPHTFAGYVAVLATRRCAVLVTPIQPDAAMCGDVRQLRLPVLVADAEDWGRDGLVDAARDAGTFGIELTGDRDAPVRVLPGLETVGGGDRYAAASGVAVTILTSGTSGAPKRIPLPYSHFAGEPPTSPRPPSQRGVSINAVPLVSVGGAVGVVNSLWRGRATALMDRFDPLQWAKLVHEHKPRRLAAPPATLRMLLDRQVPPELLASGAIFIAASAPVDLATSDEFEAVYGIPVVRAYGATEFLGAVTGFTPDDEHLARAKRGSVGRAFPGSRVRIVSAETGEELPPGEVGVLEADPAQRPVGTPRGWIRTTDLARMDEDGFVWIEGRADGVIIRGGFKVHGHEIEEVLRSHPAVADAAVVALPDPTLNEVPAAAVVLRPGADASEEELRELVRAAKPPYYVPTRIAIVGALPRNGMLKVIPARVRALIEEVRA